MRDSCKGASNNPYSSEGLDEATPLQQSEQKQQQHPSNNNNKVIDNQQNPSQQTLNNGMKSKHFTIPPQEQQIEQQSADNVKIAPVKPTFMLQFNPAMDGMYLALFQHHNFDMEAQKFLLEKRYAGTFILYAKKVLKNTDDEPTLIKIQLKYIGRNNKHKIGVIEHNVLLNDKSITDDYSSKVAQPIIPKMMSFEKKKGCGYIERTTYDSLF